MGWFRFVHRPEDRLSCRTSSNGFRGQLRLSVERSCQWSRGPMFMKDAMAWNVLGRQKVQPFSVVQFGLVADKLLSSYLGSEILASNEQQKRPLQATLSPPSGRCVVSNGVAILFAAAACPLRTWSFPSQMNN